MQVAVAIVAYRLAMSESIVDAVLKIAGFATGLVLGLYGLGLIVPRASQTSRAGGVCGGDGRDELGRVWDRAQRILVYTGG